MKARTLDSSPNIMPLYVRAAAPMIPGASLLPFVPGNSKEIPEIQLELAGIRAEPGSIAAYARVCGFSLRNHLPPTYPHVLAFPLHMAVMADGRFPFGAVGLVHIENRIEQRRPIDSGEELALTVHPTPLQRHAKGRTFSLITEARVGDELVWSSESTMLRRGKPAIEAAPDSDRTSTTHQVDAIDDSTSASADWRLPGDLGRRYGAVSGDRNPIHMHSLTAKPLGFPRAIAHGMWTKARCVAALESSLPDAFGVEVRFRKPILLPARVEFAQAGKEGETDFTVRDAKRHTPHLDGRLWPLDAKTQAGRKNSQ